MGLDSYLYRSLTTDELEAAKQAMASFESKLTVVGEQPEGGNAVIPKCINIELEMYPKRAMIAYLRGSYRIHQWFVDSLFGGVDYDDCRLACVERDNLLRFLERLQKVNRYNADEVLPSSLGEGEEYSQKEIDDARELVEYLLAHFCWEKCGLFYSAWW